jgi:hypothetical protein
MSYPYQFARWIVTLVAVIAMIVSFLILRGIVVSGWDTNQADEKAYASAPGCFTSLDIAVDPSQPACVYDNGSIVARRDRPHADPYAQGAQRHAYSLTVLDQDGKSFVVPVDNVDEWTRLIVGLPARLQFWRGELREVAVGGTYVGVEGANGLTNVGNRAMPWYCAFGFSLVVICAIWSRRRNYWRLQSF